MWRNNQRRYQMYLNMRLYMDEFSPLGWGVAEGECDCGVSYVVIAPMGVKGQVVVCHYCGRVVCRDAFLRGGDGAWITNGTTPRKINIVET